MLFIIISSCNELAEVGRVSPSSEAKWGKAKLSPVKHLLSRWT